MCKCNNSQLPVTFNNYFKLITDVHPYNTTQTKTRQFALSKACLNSGAKMIKYSAIVIWSKSPLETKNKPYLALLAAESKNRYYSASRIIFCILFIGAHKP